LRRMRMHPLVPPLWPSASLINAGRTWCSPMHPWPALSRGLCEGPPVCDLVQTWRLQGRLWGCRQLHTCLVTGLNALLQRLDLG
jgi:hypothetical protein